jgi:hypothetical protein
LRGLRLNVRRSDRHGRLLRLKIEAINVALLLREVGPVNVRDAGEIECRHDIGADPELRSARDGERTAIEHRERISNFRDATSCQGPTSNVSLQEVWLD